MTRHYPDLGSTSDWLNLISQAVRPVVASPYVGCFLRLCGMPFYYSSFIHHSGFFSLIFLLYPFRDFAPDDVLY